MDTTPDITLEQITIVSITNSNITHGIRVMIGKRMIGMEDTDMKVTIGEKKKSTREVRE